MPKCHFICLSNVPEKNKHVKHFLIHALPMEVNVLWFNMDGEMRNIKDYENEILHRSCFVRENVDIHNFEFNGLQLARLISANKSKTRGVSLSNWKLTSDSAIDFGSSLAGFSCPLIDFYSCGIEGMSDWGNHPERLSNIIEGLDGVDDVVDNLQNISLWKCGLSRDKVEGILGETRFSKAIIANLEK